MIAWRKRREEKRHVSVISQQGKANNKVFHCQGDQGKAEINSCINNQQKHLMSKQE